MFTGLVRSVGRVAHLDVADEQRTFVISAQLSAPDRILGASVSVSGVCLTVTAASEHDFTVVAAFETLAKTTLGQFAVGTPVNLEPALRVGDALGGHLVSGHVDGLACLRCRTPRGDAVLMWFDVPADLLPFIAIKGSVCVDGVSLTVNDVDEAGFAVGIIPHTLAATTLGDRAAGDAVNLEVDLLARYVARLLPTTPTPPAPGVTRDLLARAGFLAPTSTPTTGETP